MSEARAPIFSHPLNLLLLSSSAISAAWTADWRPLAVGVVAELIWLVVGRRLEGRQRDAARRAMVDDAEQSQLRSLAEPERRRFLELDTIRSDIRRLAEANPALESVGIERELAKVDSLISGWLRLAAGVAHMRAAVRDNDVEALTQAAERATEADAEAARARVEEAREAADAVNQSEAELDRVEAALRTVRDRIVSLSSSGAIGETLDELMVGVDAAERSVRDLEGLERSRRGRAQRAREN